MTKNELIHLHALLVRVAEQLLADGALAEADLAPYEALDVSPVAVRASRSEHKRAVRTLATVLVDAVDEGDETPPVLRTDEPEPAAQ